MNSKQVAIFWITSTVMLAIFAGVNWIELAFAPEAGAQEFGISGFQVFPIISALLLLQVAAILVSFLTPEIVGRAIAGLLGLIMLVHGVYVAIGVESGTQAAIGAKVTEITGVAGFAGQEGFVAFSGNTYLWVGYLLAIILNVAVLFVRALSRGPELEPRKPKESFVDEQDLWEAQN